MPYEWLEHYTLGVGYEGLGKRAEAISEYQKAIEMSDGDQGATAALAHVYAVTGRRAEAEKMLRDLERKSKDACVSPYMIATIYAGLGEKDKAFEFLEKAEREKSWDLVWGFKADLRIDNLRSDPRFQDLVRRVGFPQQIVFSRVNRPVSRDYMQRRCKLELTQGFSETLGGLEQLAL